MLAIGRHHVLYAISWHEVLSAMLAINWHKALFSFLWMSPHALLAILTVVFCRRRLYREFPIFFTYMLCELAGFIWLLTLSFIPVAGNQLGYAWSATQLLSMVLLFGVIDEVSRDLFRESQLLKVVARRSLQGVTGLLLAVSVLLAAYQPGSISIKWLAGVVEINRGAAIVQSGMVVFLLLFSRLMGLSWRRHALGITLGIGILASVNVASFALRAEFTNLTWTEFLNWLTNGDYLVCVLIWIGYVLASETKPASITIVPDEEVEIWNKEFQHLLRQ